MRLFSYFREKSRCLVWLKNEWIPLSSMKYLGPRLHLLSIPVFNTWNIRLTNQVFSCVRSENELICGTILPRENYSSNFNSIGSVKSNRFCYFNTRPDSFWAKNVVSLWPEFIFYHLIFSHNNLLQGSKKTTIRTIIIYIRTIGTPRKSRPPMYVTW